MTLNPAGHRFEPKRILIVDDSPTVLAISEDALRQAGYNVKSVLYPLDTGELLLNVVLSFRPDLILSDVDMPMVRGDEFVRIVRRIPSLAAVKVYFHSSQGIDELEHHVETTGANGYIEKSRDADTLVSSVREILKS